MAARRYEIYLRVLKNNKRKLLQPQKDSMMAEITGLTTEENHN